MLDSALLEVRTEVIVFTLAAVLFVVQLALCFHLKSKLPRLIPALVLLLLTVAFLILVFASEGWDSLGYLLLAVVTASFMGVCGLAWAIFGITIWIRRGRGRREK